MDFILVVSLKIFHFRLHFSQADTQSRSMFLYFSQKSFTLLFLEFLNSLFP